MEEENFNWAEEYIDIQNQKNIKNTNAYETLINNNIDTNELLNIEKEEGAGTYTIDKNFKPEEANKNEFVNNLLSFGEDLKTTIASRVPEGGVNILDFGTNIFNSFDRLFSLDPNYKSTDIFNKWSENLDNTRNYFKEKREGVESKVADMAGMILQDMPAYFVIDKILKNAGIKTKYRIPLSVGLSYAMSFKTEDDEHMFVPSEQIKDFKNLLGILPDTPEEELLHDFIQLGEGYGGAKIFQGIVPVIKWIKRNVPRKTVSDVAAGIAASGVIAKTAMDEVEARRTEELEKITTIDEDKIREEKKTLNFDDQSSNQSMMEEFYGLDKTQLEKISASTGYPVDQLQSASGQKILMELAKDPKTWKKVKEIVAPIFKSNVVKSVEKIPNKGSGPQILGQIKNIPGVKEAEIKWIGLDDFLKNKKTVTKQEVSDFVNQNRQLLLQLFSQTH